MPNCKLSNLILYKPISNKNFSLFLRLAKMAWLPYNPFFANIVDLLDTDKNDQ